MYHYRNFAFFIKDTWGQDFEASLLDTEWLNARYSAFTVDPINPNPFPASIAGNTRWWSVLISYKHPRTLKAFEADIKRRFPWAEQIRPIRDVQAHLAKPTQFGTSWREAGDKPRYKYAPIRCTVPLDSDRFRSAEDIKEDEEIANLLVDIVDGPVLKRARTQ